jgi:hypothetical protein
VPYLLDTQDAWLQQRDGSYLAVGTGGVSAQQALMARLQGSSRPV